MKKMPSNVGLMAAMFASSVSALSKIYETAAKQNASGTNTHPMVTSSDLDIARHNALIEQRKAIKHRDRMAALAANNRIYQLKLSGKKD
jgi:hypothetical protein